jgi:hypothetical protein
MENAETSLHNSEAPLRILSDGLRCTRPHLFIFGSNMCLLGTCDFMHPIVIPSIIDGESSPHVHDVGVVADFHIVLKTDEDVVGPDRCDEGICSDHGLVVASAFKGTYPMFFISIAVMTMHTQNSCGVRNTIVPCKHRVPLFA